MYRHWIYDNEVAEAIYHYCTQPHIYSDMEIKFQTEEFSLLEYVIKYKYSDFKKYAEDTFGFTVFLDLDMETV